MKSSNIAYAVTLLLVATAADLAAEPAATSTPGAAQPAAAPAAAPAERIREGTKVVNVVGTFQATGDRILFTSPSMPPLRVLENLALERVAQMLTERGDQRQWTVNGVVTEYRGVNHLLLQRASLKTPREP